MNMQIHRKQMIILMLAIALAAASYWIPLPQQSKPYASSSLILHESTHSSASSAEATGYARESATIWRFPVAIQIPQTPVRTISTSPAEGMGSAQALPTMPRLMDQRDFVNGDMNNSALIPIKELDYRLKR